MTVIEWIAVILAIATLAEFTMMLVNSKGYLKWASKLFTKKNAKMMRFASLVLFLVLAYYLLQEITVIQLFVALLAGMALVGSEFILFPKVFKVCLEWFKGKHSLFRIVYIYSIWVILAAWVLKEVFL